jgi:dienelactone hydrolase
VTLNYTHIPAYYKILENLPLQLAFRAQTVSQWATWRQELSLKLIELLGGFPLQPVDLNPVLLEREELSEYLLEKVAFKTDEDVYLPCYVLTPKNVNPPYRPVIALHGHGAGGAAHLVDRLVGGVDPEEERKFIANFHYDYASQLVKNGFLVFVPELTGFGERMEKLPFMANYLYSNYGEELLKSSCRAINLLYMLIGKTVNGLRVWDVMRTIDYIRSRSEPMVGGLACMGLSGGGMTTLYASAVDRRITAAVINGYFNTYRGSIASVFHCECNYIPGLLKYAEMPDIAALIAPSPLLVVSGSQDDLFPIDDVEKGYCQLEKVYNLLEIPERLDKDLYEGGHRFSDNKIYDFLNRWLV